MPGENHIKTKGKIELSDYIAGIKFNLRKRAILVICLNIIFLLYLIVLTILKKYDDTSIILVFMSIILIIFLNFHHWFILPKMAQKNYLQYKEIQKPIEREITDEYVFSSTEGSSTKREWTEFKKWKENEDLFLVYLSDYMPLIFPKSHFKTSEDINAFREILQKNIK